MTVGDLIQHRGSGRRGVVVGIETQCTAHNGCAGLSPACQCEPVGYEIAVDFGVVVTADFREIEPVKTEA